MLKVHHLTNSRAHRILWLLEELGLDYEVVIHERDPQTGFALPEFKAIHPLGKSPVLEDAGRLMAESGAIIDYIVRHYGQGRLSPDPASAEYDRYVEWLHYAEGSAMLPFLLGRYAGRLGEAAKPILPRISSEVLNHLGYISASLGSRPYLMGESFTAADIQVMFVLIVAQATGALAAFPTLGAYLERLQARPAYQRASARGGSLDMSGLSRSQPSTAKASP